ncbi:MAG: trypsin-like peptidase domain-containing protein [Lachnospiraceae bacterium]|nr:trypsin-like peptidase domain-containing protein [Lachnospiraceae bacterium]
MNKFLKGVLIVIGAAAVGAVAGLSMYGVSKATGVLDAYSNVVAEANQTISQKTEASEGKSENKVEIGKSLKPQAETPSDNPIHTNAGADVSAIAKAAMPSMVSITGMTEYEAYSNFGGFGDFGSLFGFGGMGGSPQTYETPTAGSGIIIAEDEDELMIATNNHVVEDTKDLVITFSNDTTAPAVVKGRDVDKDVAVIAVKKSDLEEGTYDYIQVAAIGDSDNLEIGEWVVAIGNALGEGLSVTVGVVSALDRTMEGEEPGSNHLIQTDAAINPGNSGGALINAAGEVIGINEAKYASTQVEGMGFAIPISSVKEILDNFSNLEARSEVSEEEQGYIGIQGQNIDSQMSQLYDMPKGIYVFKVVENTPAANSELQEKDIITKLDGQSVEDMEDLQALLKTYRAGEKVTVTVNRLNDENYEERNIELELASKKQLEAE